MGPQGADSCATRPKTRQLFPWPVHRRGSADTQIERRRPVREKIQQAAEPGLISKETRMSARRFGKLRMRRTAPFTITLTANACIRRQGMDCGNSLLNPFMRLPAPLLRHENPSRLPLQHLQPIRIADRPADGFDPPQPLQRRWRENTVTSVFTGSWQRCLQWHAFHTIIAG